MRLTDPWKKLSFDPTGHSYSYEEVSGGSSVVLILFF